jgi:4-alpha-glucanotransferase
VSEALDALCRAAGIIWEFQDGAGRQQVAPPESRRTVLAAMGLAAETDSEAADSLAGLMEERALRRLSEWQVVTAGQPARLEMRGSGDAPWRLTLEDGSVREELAKGGMDVGVLPAGRHVLDVGGYSTTLLAAPERLPETPRVWGVTLPLYGLRPERGGGIGTYGDLARAASALGGHGASFLGINPVHAGFPGDPSNFSPYAPSSRRQLNVTLIETVGEVDLGGGDLIDYPAAFESRKQALAHQYTTFCAQGGDAEFDAYRARRGEALALFATHQALSEAHGPYWVDWPEAFRSPKNREVGEFIASRGERIGFHAWLQWTAETQLKAAQDAARAAGMRYGLYLDLAVGTHPSGAETWADPSLFARGVSLGAPPDAFSPEGQVWGVAPLSPRALARTGFAVLAETLREQLRFSGLLRIDHVLGFDRAFWCPGGLPGVYVAMPKAAMLAIVRMEAARAGASIIGEDLGNIPDGLRHDLEASGILGCRVAMFERDWDGGGAFRPNGSYDGQVLASFSSHDLPTWLGWRKGLDISWRNRIGEIDDETTGRETERRIDEVTAFDATTGDSSGSADAMHRFLAGAASRLVALQAEDILGLEEQANLPGTVFQYPNWRRRLPVAASEIATDERFERTARIMSQAGR